MNSKTWIFGACLLSTLSAATIWAQETAPPNAAELLAGSIAYHDPEGVWETGAFRLELAETRPNGPDRETVLSIDNSKGRFEITTQRGETPLTGKLAGEACEITIDGEANPSAEAQEANRWTCERLAWIRNYYTYLWGLPMKLRDPGTPLDPAAELTTFENRPVYGLRVAYEEPVGDDIWYFYLDRETLELVGYRFYHDEAVGDGEVIPLEGEIEGAGLRLPKSRAWYKHQGGDHLGTDILISLQSFDD